MNVPQSGIRIENYTYKRADNIRTDFTSSKHEIRTASNLFPDFFRSCIAEEFILFICNEGRGLLTICGRQYSMEKGACACILPDDFFSFRTPAAKTNSGDFFCSCTVIFVPFDSVSRKISAVLLSARTFAKDLVCSKGKWADAPFVKYAENLTVYSGAFRDVYIRNTVENIMLEVFSHSPKIRKISPSFGTENDDAFLFTAAFIHLNYKKTCFLLSDAAEQAHYNPHYFSKNFKAFFSKGFTRYTCDLRLHYAASLLASSRLMIKDISSKCLVDSPSYLTKEFIKKYNVTPKEYRKKYS